MSGYYVVASHGWCHENFKAWWEFDEIAHFPFFSTDHHNLKYMVPMGKRT